MRAEDLKTDLEEILARTGTPPNLKTMDCLIKYFRSNMDRNHIAIEAMNGLITINANNKISDLVFKSYKIADAMIAESEE